MCVHDPFMSKNVFILQPRERPSQYSTDCLLAALSTPTSVYFFIHLRLSSCPEDPFLFTVSSLFSLAPFNLVTGYKKNSFEIYVHMFFLNCCCCNLLRFCNKINCPLRTEVVHLRINDPLLPTHKLTRQMYTAFKMKTFQNHGQQ